MEDVHNIVSSISFHLLDMVFIMLGGYWLVH